MHLVSTRRWWSLRGASPGAQRTCSQPEGSIRWGLAVMAESAPAQVSVLSWHDSGARSGWRSCCLRLRAPRAAAAAGKHRFLPRPQGSTLSFSGAPASRALPGKLFRDLFHVVAVVTVPTCFLRCAKRARFRAGEMAHIGNSGTCSLPVSFPGAPRTSGFCFSATSSFSAWCISLLLSATFSRDIFCPGVAAKVKVRLGFFSLRAGVTSRCSCRILFVNCPIAFPRSPSDSQSGMSWHKAWGKENLGHRIRKLDFSRNSALSDAVLGFCFLSCKLLG